MNPFKMLVRLSMVLVAMLIGTHCLHAQSSPAQSALNRMAKGKWLKAEQILTKALRKDKLNPEVRYVYSLLFFNTTAPKNSIDSAYHYSLASLSDFRHSSIRQKERMKRFPLDSSILVALREKIDSSAFERAKANNTTIDYQYFLDHFAFASQRDAAVELRDEVAFVGALKINTFRAFGDFLNQYPASHRAEEAKRRYEKLLFEEKTKDGRLNSFKKFLEEYPFTTHRKEAEKNIFEISTASGKPDSFIEFIQRYPKSAFRKQSADILYHLRDVEEHYLEIMLLDDSLKRIRSLEKGYWVAVMKNEKFGFMNELGEETIAPKFDIIYEDYKCGEIRSDILITSAGIISRDGEIIFKGITEEVVDLGLGFLKVQDSTCIHIVHKSGFKLNSLCLEDVRIVSNQFIAYKVNTKWGLMTFSGLHILPSDFEDIYSLKQIIVLVKSGKHSLKTPEQMDALADKNSFTSSIVFDEIRQLDEDSYLVRNGSLEGIINSKLKFVVPLDRQVLAKTPYGYVAEKNNRFTVIGIADNLSNQSYDEIRFYENWLSLKSEDGLQLFSIPAKMNVATAMDSIWFLNHLVFGLKEDTLNVFLSSGLQKKVPAQSGFQFVKSSDMEIFFYTAEKNKKSVYEASTGNQLFQLAFDEIEYFGSQVFMITNEGKKGLVGIDGKLVLAAEYAAIVLTQNGYASLFKDKKFGLYDLSKRKLIKPLFERNVKPFRDNIFVSFKDGYYGFIDADSKPISNFEFDEILEWNDSSALVKSNFQWKIYNWHTHKIVFDKVRDYQVVLNSVKEKIMIVHQEHGYGVISNRKGIIIPPTFSDVINIGSDETPLYFTEKNVEEAEIYVVIYYDQHGKLLRRQVFESDEYDEIYCADR
ncbi:MAG: WG repeat-containing protein [Bacteroidia bacterium]|nr:WG repeat-containing protein [Bacteroidia bacterium]